jgi:E3 ubiquitin-protein ligase DOA10
MCGSFARPKLLLGLNPTIPPDVLDRYATIGQDPRNEEPPMTSSGVLLATHDRYAAPRQAVLQALHAGAEEVAFRNAPVQNVILIVVVFVPIWTPAELMAHEEVLDPNAIKRRGQRLPVELRRELRRRIRPYVDHDLHSRLLKELEKVLERMVGVSDGQEGVHVSTQPS